MKKYYKAWLASAVLPLCALLSSNSAAVEAPLLADAHINIAIPSTNLGSVTTLNVGNGNSALLSFDLVTLPAGTTRSKVTKATMLLWVNKIGTAGAFDVLPVTTGWTENGVTYNAAPGIGASAVATVPVLVAAQYIAVDVTELVKTWIDYPAQNFGLAITASATQPATIAAFDSKENTLTGHAAMLDITLDSEGPAGSVGPQGIAGVKGDKGDKGDIGAVGATGPVGPAGATGAQGIKGDKGDVGATGATGATGAVGAIGPVGPAGAAGAQGIKGDKGDPGTSVAGLITDVKASCPGTACSVQCPAAAQTALSGGCELLGEPANFPLNAFGIIRRTGDGDIFYCAISSNRGVTASVSCISRAALHN